MKASGDTDKGGAKKTEPSDKTTATDQDRQDQDARGPVPPSESERAAAAKSNPLRTPADGERTTPQDSAGKTTKDDDAGESKEPAAGGTGSSAGAPELRISARMLSAQPPANSNTNTPSDEAPPPPRPTAGKTRNRRRVKSLARPVEPEVVNPLRLVWPRANSRRSARIASRYGFVGFILALIWIGVALPTNAVSQAFSFSSSSTAIAVIIGAIAALVLIVVGYYQQSRLAALLGLIAIVTLVVLDHQAEPVSWAETAGQIVIIYLLLHGVHGTIAYHIFGKRKRRKSSGYRYKGYGDY